MTYRGEIEQITIFGQVEFINTENYTNKATKDGHITVSGLYKIVGSEETIDLSLEFFGKELDKHVNF